MLHPQVAIMARALACALTMMLLAAALAAVLPAAAHAAIDDQPAGTDYRGWGYLHGGRTLPVWLWSGQQWQAEVAAAATPAWIEPWTTDWSWAWYGTGWHAVSSSRVRQWSCDRAGARSERLANAASALALNASGSAVVSHLARGTIVEQVCTNSFADAAPTAACTTLGGCSTTRFRLVRIANCGWFDATLSWVCDNTTRDAYVPTAAFTSTAAGGGGGGGGGTGTTATARRVFVRRITGHLTHQGLPHGTAIVRGTTTTMRVTMHVTVAGRTVLRQGVQLENGRNGSTHSVGFYAYDPAGMRRGTAIRVVVTVRGGGKFHRRVRTFTTP